MPICDFCSAPNVTARYNAKDFACDTLVITDLDKTHIEFDQVSLGDWAACAQCETLIDAKEWDALLARAVTEFFHHNPASIGVVPEPMLKEHLKRMYATLLNMGFKKGEL